MSEELNGTSAQLEHVESFAAPTSPRTPFDKALLTYLGLLARHGRDGTRDGRRSAMLQALEGKATWSQVREWRRGRARAPQWAIVLLNKKIESRARALDNSRIELVA